MPASPPCLDARSRRVIDRALQILERRMRPGGQTVFGNPHITQSYFRLRMSALPREEFHACWLNAPLRLIAVETLFVGTLTETAVYPREVVKSALRHNAAAVIVAHNHPSGSPEPSTADISLTKTLRSALRVIDVRLLDHIVVGADGAVSLAARNLL